jgi:DNA-binding transcriptional LysR family regulator
LCNGFAFALNQRHARLFRASANGGNLSVASEHLGLCLPAFTKYLAETESPLGSALLLR